MGYTFSFIIDENESAPKYKWPSQYDVLCVGCKYSGGGVLVDLNDGEPMILVQFWYPHLVNSGFNASSYFLF